MLSDKELRLFQKECLTQENGAFLTKTCHKLLTALAQVPQRWLGSKFLIFFLADFERKSLDFERKRIENESNRTIIALHFFQMQCSGKKFF